MTLGEHLTTIASASMFCIGTDYKNKANMKVAASNINIKIDRIIGVRVTIAKRKKSRRT